MKVDDEFLNRLARIAYVPTTSREEEQPSDQKKVEEEVETVEGVEVEAVDEASWGTNNIGEKVADEKVTRARLQKKGDDKAQPFWRTVHRLASEADKMLGLDKKTPENRKRNSEKYELDSALLEANMWLNM